MNIIYARQVGQQGVIEEKGQVRYQSRYVVKTDDVAASRAQILLSAALPAWGTFSTEVPLAILIRKDAQRNKDNPYLWDVTCEWTQNPASGRDPNDDNQQPDLRRPKWSAAFVPFPVQRFVDLKGQLLVDKAGTLFDPAPDIPITVDQITIARYEYSCDRAAQRGYIRATNADTWLGAQPGEGLVDDISVQDEFIQGQYWFLTTYRLFIKPRIEISLPKGRSQKVGGYDPEYVLNAGPLVIGNDGKPVPPSKKGFYDGRPIMLTDAGKEIARDAAGHLQDDPIFLEFHVCNPKSWGALQLDPPPGWVGS